MTDLLFGNRLHAFKSSKYSTENDAVLNFERLQTNQDAGIETNFVTDTNLMIEIDRACEPEMPSTDSTLKELHLLEWVNFLRECDRRNLYYAFTPFFAYSEMPASLAQLRAARLDLFSQRFGLRWHDIEPRDNFNNIGRADVTFESLGEDQQRFVSLSFSALLLMLVINRDGREFSPIGKFKRYVREYKKLIGTVSVRELAIARYVFASTADCPGDLDKLRSVIEKNFARNKKRKPPTIVDDMCTTALNGAFDLQLFNAMNIADTKGLNGRKLDCWLFSFDEKLKAYNDLCFNVSLGTGQAGMFTAITSHADVSEYWAESSRTLHEFASLGSKRALESMIRSYFGTSEDEEIRKKIFALPGIAHAVIEFARTGF